MRQSRQISIGNVKIGGGAPVSVQSMTITDTRDVASTVSQIKRLEDAGCDIVRVAVPDMDAARALGAIRKGIRIPLVSDIHFDYKLALESIKQGVDGMRINPGNIGAKYRIKAVVDACRERGIPIRIGVNSGSLQKDILRKHKHPTAEALVESALRHVHILEDLDFYEIKISVKSTDVRKMIAAYRMLSEKTEYPLHLGVTEAGTPGMGTVKSSIGIGALLAEGIGDTIRVSLTGDPVEEIVVGMNILRSLGMRNNGIELISCPGCGRLEIDLEKLVSEVEQAVSGFDLPRPVKVALLGCVVNGPGEASEADIGIAGGRGKGMLYRDGKLIKSFKEADLVGELVKEIERNYVN
ncbi:MAG: flavodoxin-dependent (E)-4-hydroxy-3-methylbut-2-enyl-diphosphate synthase [Candidatus Dadabacteria bacterium]|nr:flavodoxin-dependent (E)-4-hydroxy-3-methylbut-2-enyl-diphosphate synthase [Candidatus Dadabacteria bacterium]MYA47737.1 flavodoxin-dependent (E)-4-hydroxy-3-methylbut-2-enyl-diphosphate synthase [Candidatus Dadabacteria bacterium]MYF47805.1 flavodoxin-dependent (E)-4-hydroxy-3-methylbut-2-enyl-diphosphate synthase [Candidatus Dadabacteria bacterium]MYK50095.1 flavodoxin-dependent (E)-4-hydroxy-3-methylbut-2-enyl-diphosphate synthase [Candidatus Dadabacteria bacterium]